VASVHHGECEIRNLKCIRGRAGFPHGFRIGNSHARRKVYTDAEKKHGASFMVADVGRSGAMVGSMMKLVDPE
jgi:hypothetical protein